MTEIKIKLIMAASQKLMAEYRKEHPLPFGAPESVLSVYLDDQMKFINRELEKLGIASPSPV